MVSIRGYDHFLALIRHAAFVVTDGGSIQEECYALDIPCLLARARTERRDGLGENVCLSGFDRRTITRFIGSYHTYHRTQPRAQTSASEKIARILQDLDTKG